MSFIKYEGSRLKPRLLYALSSNLVVLELPLRNISLEHDIQFLVRPPLHFGHSKIAPQQARQRKPSKEEAEFTTEIGLVGVDEVGDCDGHDDANDGLDGSCDGDGLRAHAGCADFTEDGVGDGADTEQDVSMAVF